MTTNLGGATFTVGQGEQWAGVALPLVRKVFGSISSKEFVSVQPMNLPSGLVFFLDFQYGDANGKVAPTGPFGPGGGGFALNESSRNFINKYCGGVAPVTLYADGTAVVIRTENGGARSILKPNPSYQAALATIKMPFKGKPGGQGLAVHPDFAAKLAPAFAEITANGGGEYIESFAGSYYPRNVTGGSRLSHHSYGFAFDINTTRGGTFGYGVHWNLEKQTVGGRPWTDWERTFYEKVASTPDTVICIPTANPCAAAVVNVATLEVSALLVTDAVMVGKTLSIS